MIASLIQLDKWRKSIDLPTIVNDLKETVKLYFQRQNFSLYIPSREVFIRKYVKKENNWSTVDELRIWS